MVEIEVAAGRKEDNLEGSGGDTYYLAWRGREGGILDLKKLPGHCFHRVLKRGCDHATVPTTFGSIPASKSLFGPFPPQPNAGKKDSLSLLPSPRGRRNG